MSPQKQSFFSTKVLRHIVFSACLEFGPVLLFLSSTEYLSIYESTVLLMIGTIVSTFLTYWLQKRIPYLALFIALITTIFGTLTIHFHQMRFIQMRDTLYDLICALTLVAGLVFRKQFLKLAFQDIFQITNRAWDRLTHLWIGYFLLTAFANEIVRNFFRFSDWLFFKGVVLAVTSVFGLLALYICFEPKEDHHPRT